MLSIIKRSFESLAKGWKVLAILAVMLIAFNLINLAALPARGATEPTDAQVAIVLLSVIIFIAASAFVNAGVICFFRDLLKTGSARIEDFVDNAKRYFVRMLALLVIIMAISLLIGMLGNLLVAVFPGGVLIIFLMQLLVGVLLVFPIYVAVLEDKGAIESLKIAVQKSVQNYAKVLLLLILLILLLFGFLLVAALLLGIIQLVIKGAVLNVLTALLWGGATAVWVYLSMHVLTEYYLQLTATPAPQA